MKYMIAAALLWYAMPGQLLRAQDANYWQSNYGPAGMLTPGAVIANDNNKGFFYYNPALLAINPKSSVSLSASIYQYESLVIKNGVGDKLDLAGKNFRINPQMIAGTIAFRKKKTIALGYALLHNPVLGFQTTQRQDKLMQVLDDSYSPGKEYYIGQYLAHNRINMTTAVLSAGIKLNRSWSLGLTAEGRIRNQDFFQNYTSRAFINLPDSNAAFPQLTSVQSSYQLTYTHAGIRFRAGAAYDNGRHHAGLLVTSPMITLWGSADLTSDLVISNLRVVGLNTSAYLLANGQQNSLPVKYREPLSIAASYAYDYGYGQLSVTGEFFLPVKTYNIVTPRNESFLRPDTGGNRALTSDLLKFVDERKQVVNIALGASYFINPDITAFLSVETDFCYASNNEINGFYPNTTAFDSYHAQIGGNFKRRKVNLRAGFLLSYGRSDQYLQPVNFSNPNENNFLIGDPGMVKGSYFSAGFMLAYVYNL